MQFRINGMFIFITVGILFSCNIGKAQNDLPMQPGTCSRKCSNTNNTELQSNRRRLFNCSCSSSCTLYEDCCYDSPYKMSVNNISTSMMCILLSGNGMYKAVRQCSPEWQGSSNICSESMGHLAPVTNIESGVTYSNIHCAHCNGENLNLRTWNADLRCCPEHSQIEDSQIRYVYLRNHIWSVLDSDDSNPASSTNCRCAYSAHDNNATFLQDLETRRCGQDIHISSCSYSWSNNDIKKLCESYLDPVYIRDHVYRNIYCAQCNYESLESITCNPPIVDQMLSAGYTEEQIIEYCTTHGMQSCRYFFSSSRGDDFFFHNMFYIYEVACVPPEGERCCAGKRYDFENKRCRKIRP